MIGIEMPKPRSIKYNIKRSGVFIWKTLLCICTLSILILCLVPASKISGNTGLPHLDKVAHILMYFSFSLLYLISFVVNESLRGYVRLLGIVFFMGSAIEIFQEILPFQRNASILDVIANFIGCLSAIGIYRTFFRSSGRWYSE